MATTAKPFLARLGLAVGLAGSLSVPSLSLGLETTGLYSVVTPSSEVIGLSLAGIQGPTFARNGSAVDSTFPGAVTITGNLTVNGTTTTINSTTIDVTDRVIRVNKSAGANDPVPSAITGIAVYRGAVASVARDHYGLYWDETATEWKLAVNTGGDDATLGAYLNLHVLGLTASSITLGAQTANRVYAGPTSGGSASPTFRALVNADIPSTLSLAALTVNANAAALQAATTGTLVQIGNADGVTTRLLVDAYGTGVAPIVTSRLARGTAAAPTAVQTDDTIGSHNAYAYGATGYSATFRGRLAIIAAENWTDAAQGTYLSFGVTTPTTLTAVEALRLTSTAGTFSGTVTTAGTITAKSGSLCGIALVPQGGAANFTGSVTTALLTASRTYTLPDYNTTIIGGSVGSTQIAYGTATGMTSDSGLVRSSLVLTVDPNTDNTFTTGYGVMGFVATAASGRFFIAQASNFTLTNYAFSQNAAGGTVLNSASGQSTLIAVNNVSKLTVSGSSATFASGVPVTISDTTASTTTAGALLIGTGVAATSVTFGGGNGNVGGTLTTGGAFSAGANTDSVNQIGYGMMGLATSGTSTQFYIAQASCFNNTDYALKQLSGGTTEINSKTGTNVVLGVNNATKMTVSATIVSTATSVQFSVLDTTASTTTTTGCAIFAGGIGAVGQVTGGSWVSSGNLQTNGGRMISAATTITTAAGSGSTGWWRSGGTIGTAGDMVLQSDLGVTNAAFVFRAGPTTPITVATISGAAVAGTTPGFAIVGTSTITGGVTDGYNGSLRLTATYDAATALTVTRHNYIDLPNVALTGAGPAALTDACLFRTNAAIGTHKMIDAATTKTTPGGVDAWVKFDSNGTIVYIPGYLSKTA